MSINSGNISFQVHSWGGLVSVPGTGTFAVSDFTKNYYGYGSAKPK